MKHRLMTTALLMVTALILSTFATFSGTKPAAAAPNRPPGTHWPIDGYGPRDSDNAILKWDEKLLQIIRSYPKETGPTVTSRAIAILHTATYDAWTAYDATALPTMANGNGKQPLSSDPAVNNANKSKAISYAAYQVLTDLFPRGRFPVAYEPAPGIDLDGQLAPYGPADSAPAVVGRKAADAVIAYRHHDGANQLGDQQDSDPVNPWYSDYTAPGYTKYQPTTTWGQTPEPGRWQPLCVPLPADGQPCTGMIQKAYTPHWKNVTPFALDTFDQFKPPGPPQPAAGSPYPYDTKDIGTALADTSNLTDAKKVTAEYWADGPKTEFPPGHWAVIAQALSRKRGHSLDTDAKMFFVLGNAVLDAGISSWSAKFKKEWDFWRPTTAIRYHYGNLNQKINSWLGPYKGYGLVPAGEWRPYQAPGVVTPPFPEYTSGHSTFSGAARVAIVAFTGTDSFSARVTIPAGTSIFEPRVPDKGIAGTPAKDVVLSWKNLLDASHQAGMSRRYGGIHFYTGDMHGRANGASVGYYVYDKATKYFSGKGVSPMPMPTTP